jgi:hypothetical protein
MYFKFSVFAGFNAALLAMGLVSTEISRSTTIARLFQCCFACNGFSIEPRSKFHRWSGSFNASRQIKDMI